MTPEQISNLTDEDLLSEAKKQKSGSTLNALLIGIMVGVLIYGFAKNNFGFFALVPLFIVYKLINGSKQDRALKKELEERGLNQ